MKSKILALLAISVAITLTAQAAVIVDSGTNGTTFTTFGVFSGTNTGKAVGFTLGNSAALGPSASSGYALDSITVRLTNPQASTMLASDYTFSLWSSDAGQSPSAQLITFTSVNLTASTTANYTLAVSAPFTLHPSTSYWIVAQSTVTSNQPSWMGTGNTATLATGISLTSPIAVFGNGSPAAWGTTSGLYNDIQINATAVPEPSAGIMFLGSVGILLGLRRRVVRSITA